MDNSCRRAEKIVSSSLEFLLMEAFRIKDELTTTPYETVEKPGDVYPEAQGETDLLIELLSRSPEIQDFAVFDENNFLEHQQGSTKVLPRLDTGGFYKLCSELEQNFNAGKPRFIQFTTEAKRRHLLFFHNQSRIALTLAQGARAEKVFDEISAVSQAKTHFLTKELL
jgi:hypothetical protein